MIASAYRHIRRSYWRRIKGKPFFSLDQARCHWIDTPSKLRRILPRLLKEKELAIDTETNSLYAYQERVCLVQIGTYDEDFIIDPLAFPNPEELGVLNEISSNPRIEKIFHGSDYDISGLRRDFGLEWENIFDTYLAARYLNYDKVGLMDLVAGYFGIYLDKTLTKFNWAIRPIPDAELNYAREDVRYLIAVKMILDQELHDAGIRDHIQTDFDRLSAKEFQERERDGFEFARIKGAVNLNPVQLRRLRELYDYREKKARSRDVPTFKVFSNQVLLDIARVASEDDFAALQQIKGLPGARRYQVIQELRSLLIRADHRAPIESIPTKEPAKRGGKKKKIAQPYFSRKRASDELKSWRQSRAGEKIHPNAVLPNAAIDALLQAEPQTREDLFSIPYLGASRIRDYGDEILAILKKCKL